MAETPGEFWNELRDAGKGDGRLEVPSRTTAVGTGYGKVRMALGEQGEPRLLVPCGISEMGKQFLNTEALRIWTTRFSLNGSSSSFIDLQCLDQKLDAVFGDLVSELLSRLEAGNPPGEAVSSTVEDFRALLVSSSRDDVTREKLLGLVGELHVLERLVKVHGSGILKAWVGPHEQRHDFRVGTQAIEVKTSARSDATHITVHGIDQLSPPKGGALLLVHLSLEETEGGNLTVAKLFDKLVKDGVDSVLLLDQLHSAGCDDPHDKVWNRSGFNVEGEQSWEVTTGFPRLTEAELARGELPNGIDLLRYTVDLAAAENYRLPSDSYIAWLEGMAP